MTAESGESSEALGPLFPLLPDLRLLFSTYCHGFKQGKVDWVVQSIILKLVMRFLVNFFDGE
jgi:hypothetical protein